MTTGQRIYRFLNDRNVALINVILMSVIVVITILNFWIYYNFEINPPKPDLTYQIIETFPIGDKFITCILIQNTGPPAEEVVLSIRTPPADMYTCIR